jgi:hypothetical protein
VSVSVVVVVVLVSGGGGDVRQRTKDVPGRRVSVAVLIIYIIMYKHAKTGAKRFFLQKTKKKIENILLFQIFFVPLHT